MTTLRHDRGVQESRADQAISAGALARLVPELVAGMPEGLSLSAVQRTAAVHGHLGPLPDAEERSVRRLLTSLSRTPKPAQVPGRFLLERGFPGLIDWGPIPELATGDKPPIPMGIPDLWEGRDRAEVVGLLSPLLLDRGSRDERRKLLEDQLAEGLRERRFRVGRWKPGLGSDLCVWVDGIPINLECRNRAFEVMDRLNDRDGIFETLAALGCPSVYVSGGVTHRLRSQVAEATYGLGGVVEIGCCVVRDQDVENLAGWSPFSLGRLPEVAVSAVVDELERVAARVRGAESHHVASPVAGMGSGVSGSEVPQQVEDGGTRGDTEAVALAGRMRRSDDDLLEAAREYRARYRRGHPDRRQEEVAKALEEGYDRLRELWRLRGGERW